MRDSIKVVLSKLNFKSYLHYKFLLQIIEVLVSDTDEHLNNKTRVYDFLGVELNQEPETIKTRLKIINNNFDKTQYQLLGFEEKPKSTELLDRIIELSKQEKQQNKVETTDEHER